MNTNKKKEMSLSFLKTPSKVDELSQQFGIAPSELRSTAFHLRSNGYLAFTPSHLSVAIATLSSKEKLVAVQVGANDGRTGDPVRTLFHAHAKKVLLIEPIPELIADLEDSYKSFSGQVVIENIAIGSSSGVFSLNRLKPSLWENYIQNVGRHPTHISSFDRNMVVEKIMDRLSLERPDAEEAVETLECPMRTLSDVIEEHQFADIDMLQVDCEGYDIAVIESMGDYRPAIINFESFNLSDADWNRWKAWARANNYGFMQGRMDTLAVRGAQFRSEY